MGVSVEMQCPIALLLRYYSHAYYRNGFFRDPSSVDKNVLTFENGFYALEFDVFDWSKDTVDESKMK
jgi:hypothetical protein